MADPVPNMEMNTGTQAAPTWSSVMSGEWRFATTNVTANTASASWPQETRPTSGTSQLNFIHAYTADAVGAVVIGTFALTNFHMCRWTPTVPASTFASNPILTAYASTSHASITRGDNTILGGNTTDTGATQRSYLKATAYGQAFQSTDNVPASAPTGSFPTVTDGTTGAVSAADTTHWSNAAGAWQGLQGDNDFIQTGGTQQATLASTNTHWEFMLALFMGANETPGLLQPVCSLKYTWT